MNGPFSNVYAAPEKSSAMDSQGICQRVHTLDLLIEDHIPLTGLQLRVDQ
jgi:hypothetical protein